MKKRNILIIVACIVCVALVVLIMFLSRVCRPSFSVDTVKSKNDNSVNDYNAGKEFDIVDKNDDNSASTSAGDLGNLDLNDPNSFMEEDTLTGLFDSESAAEKAAEQYNIILLSYDYGVAVFQLQSWQNADEVIQLGKDKGWTELSTNKVRELY